MTVSICYKFVMIDNLLIKFVSAPPPTIAYWGVHDNYLLQFTTSDGNIYYYDSQDQYYGSMWYVVINGEWEELSEEPYEYMDNLVENFPYEDKNNRWT